MFSTCPISMMFRVIVPRSGKAKHKLTWPTGGMSLKSPSTAPHTQPQCWLRGLPRLGTGGLRAPKKTQTPPLPARQESICTAFLIPRSWEGPPGGNSVVSSCSLGWQGTLHNHALGQQAHGQRDKAITRLDSPYGTSRETSQASPHVPALDQPGADGKAFP